MKNRLYSYMSLAVAIALFVGCAKQDRRTSFKVKNYSDEPIFVNYKVFETMDTFIVEIEVNQDYELFSSEANIESGYNWYYDNGMEIRSILNTTGDTIDFNPNLPQYWINSTGNSGRVYLLDITNWSF